VTRIIATHNNNIILRQQSEWCRYKWLADRLRFLRPIDDDSVGHSSENLISSTATVGYPGRLQWLAAGGRRTSSMTDIDTTTTPRPVFCQQTNRSRLHETLVCLSIRVESTETTSAWISVTDRKIMLDVFESSFSDEADMYKD